MERNLDVYSRQKIAINKIYLIIIVELLNNGNNYKIIKYHFY